MKLHSILLAILLFICPTINASDLPKISLWEGGISFGPTFGLKPNNSYTGRTGANGSLDLRYNFENSRWDIGASIVFNATLWDRVDENNEFIREENNNNTAVLVTGHYNLLQGKKINPFIGFGFGVSHIHSSNENRRIPDKSAIFCPAIGLELFYHVRINAGFYLSRSGFNSFALSAGFVIGGRPKKPKKSE